MIFFMFSHQIFYQIPRFFCKQKKGPKGLCEMSDVSLSQAYSPISSNKGALKLSAQLYWVIKWPSNGCAMLVFPST